MGYHYSDPTAERAMGKIDSEFSRLKKKAELLRDQINEGTLSAEVLKRERSRFKGIYRNVLDNVLKENA
jgi:hypothetical protein